MKFSNRRMLAAIVAIGITGVFLQARTAPVSKSGVECAVDSIAGYSIPVAPSPSPTPAPVVRTAEEWNGITVGEPKVYDDALLQQMLQDAEARLATLQLVDQTEIAKKLGAVTGASQQISSFGLNLQGVPVPGVTTTSKGATGGTSQSTTSGTTNSSTLSTTQSTTSGTTNSSTFQATSGSPSQDVVTTTSQVSPPAATAPAPSTTLPSAFSVSSSDILNEQMQLTAEVNSLRLLLSGSLSDHFITNPDPRSPMTKLRTTLGFPITVSPNRRYKNAVAIVEVQVAKTTESLSDEPPAITALLPREKTYNVAAITDKSVSIGGGVATQILGFSGSWLFGRKTYYLVQDQDTVALTFNPLFEPQSRQKVGFLWQFRPVLGREYVKAGLKQTFVQLAFAVPPDAGAGQIGRVRVQTYWRKYDKKTGVTGEIIPGSLNVNVLNFDIPKFSLVRTPLSFNAPQNLEDLGGGQMLVKLFGRLLPGTNVRIGNTILAEGPQFKQRYLRIEFIAPISDLAVKRVFLTAHDGDEMPLLFDAKYDNTLCSPSRPLKIMIAGGRQHVQITTVDDSNSRVSLDINDAAFLQDGPPPIVMVIGQRVFGYSDAPLKKSGTTLSVVVPTALLIANPKVTVQTLFPGRGCIDSAEIKDFNTQGQTERLIPLEQGKDSVKFLLYGTRLTTARILSPEHVDLHYVDSTLKNDDTLRLIELTNDQLKTNKQLLIMRTDEKPFRVDIPALDAKKPDQPKASERVTVDADEAIIEGEGLKDVVKITFKKKEFKASDMDVAANGKSLRLSGLKAAGVTATAASQPVVLEFKSGAKVTVTIEVVNTKVETVAK